MKISNLKNLITATAQRDNAAAIRAIDELLAHEEKPAWVRELRKLAEFLADGYPRFSIFAVGGNSKLPFVSFSAMPGVGFCPGAGECVNFCYSFRSWRYPAAFCRQVQNSFLLNTKGGQETIYDELADISCQRKFKKLLATGAKIDLRLYVDGDFRDLDDLVFWFDTLGSADGQLFAAYGYSKSFAQFREYDHLVEYSLGKLKPGRVFNWPNNYVLNLSGGHRHDADTVEFMKSLPITRGEFIAVNVGHKVTSAMHGTSEHNATLRAAHGRKAFTCPGKCGECTPGGHACGSDRFRGIDIIIAVH